jgi:hypothetical protein
MALAGSEVGVRGENVKTFGLLHIYGNRALLLTLAPRMKALIDKRRLALRQLLVFVSAPLVRPLLSESSLYDAAPSMFGCRRSMQL